MTLKPDLRRILLIMLALALVALTRECRGEIVVWGQRSLSHKASENASFGIPVPRFPSTGVIPLFGSPLLQMTEFSVDAETKKGDYIKASNDGGVLFIKGKYLRITPWNTIYDAKTETWVVFLANVTSNNFRIAFLYLRNGTGAFNLWYYEYDSALFEGYIFYGADQVRNRTRITPPVLRQSLSISPEAKNPSRVSALGPTLFLNDVHGLYLNRTETLSLYPLLCRTFASVSEIWLLIDDHRGGYYYSIFYVFETDRAHVLRAHTLRLNDLCQAPFENISVQWMPGPFPYSLSVISNQGNVTAKINGFPFKSGQSGRMTVRVPAGDIEIEAQKEIATGNGSRRVFHEWKWLTKSNPTIVKVTQNTDLYPTYGLQHYLSISSTHGSPKGEGWYDSGATAEFSVEPLVGFSNGTRLVFSRWTGDQDTTSSNGTIAVDRPKMLRANWKWQYETQVTTEGLPSGTAMNLTINGNQTATTVPFTYRCWTDLNSALTIRIDPISFLSSQTRYVLRQWHTESGTALTFPVTVKGPMQITARYEAMEPFVGKITLQADPTVLLLRDTAIIKGTTNPARPSTTVNLLWSRDSREWFLLAAVVTSSDGSYEYTWKVQNFDKLYLKASWIYDRDFEPLESSVISVARVNSIGGALSQFPEFINGLFALLANVPIVKQLIAAISLPVTRIHEAAGQTSIAALTVLICLALLVVLVVAVRKRKAHRQS